MYDTKLSLPTVLVIISTSDSSEQIKTFFFRELYLVSDLTAAQRKAGIPTTPKKLEHSTAARQHNEPLHCTHTRVQSFKDWSFRTQQHSHQEISDNEKAKQKQKRSALSDRWYTSVFNGPHSSEQKHSLQINGSSFR